MENNQNTPEHYLKTMYDFKDDKYYSKSDNECFTIEEIIDRYNKGLDSDYLLYLFKIQENGK